MSEPLYWEYYDDQTSDDYDKVSYTDLGGNVIIVDAEEDLAAQVYEIRRKYGADSEIKVYARQVELV